MLSKKIGVGVIGTGMAAKPHALALNDLKINVMHSLKIIILKLQIQFKKFLQIITLIWLF